MPRGWHRAETQCRRQVERNQVQICTRKGERERGKDGLGYKSVCLCMCAPPTSEALTRPSWKEQLEGSWVHKLRYLHQWHRKALFTHDRHLQEHTNTHMHTHWVKGGKKKNSAVKEGQRVCQSRGKCHIGNEIMSQVGTCCCCALVVGTVPNSC